MKETNVRLVSVGAVVGLRSAMRRMGLRRMGQKMRAHCEQMAAQWGRGEAVGRT
jgi:hypothetical protein